MSVSLVAFFCILSLGSSAPRDEEPQWLHVVVDQIPQCGYGVGYARPLRVDLTYQSEPLASVFHAGVYTGEESLRLSLHVPAAAAGRYRLRYGLCPDPIESPGASVRCAEVDWLRDQRVRLAPAGPESPEYVRPRQLEIQCADRSMAFHAR